MVVKQPIPVEEFRWRVFLESLSPASDADAQRKVESEFTIKPKITIQNRGIGPWFTLEEGDKELCPVSHGLEEAVQMALRPGSFGRSDQDLWGV